MSIYMGRDAEFKAIYEHLKSAERIMESMKCYKSDDVNYQDLALQIKNIADNFSERYQAQEEAWRQVYDKVRMVYLHKADKRKMIKSLIERSQNILFFNKDNLDEIISKYFNNSFVQAYMAMDKKTLSYVTSDYTGSTLALYLDTMKIQREYRTFNHIQNRKKFVAFMLADPEGINVLGYKEHTILRLRKLMKLD